MYIVSDHHNTVSLYIQKSEIHKGSKEGKKGYDLKSCSQEWKIAYQRHGTTKIHSQYKHLAPTRETKKKYITAKWEIEIRKRRHDHWYT